MPTQKMKISDILKELKSSVDLYYFDGEPESWISFLEDKFCPRIAEDLLERGQLDPISIKDFDGEVQQSNGHHRLAAAILLGWDEILVTTDWYGNWSNSGIESDYLNTHPDGDFYLSAFQEMRGSLYDRV